MGVRDEARAEARLAQPAARVHLGRQLAVAEDVDLLAEAVVGDVQVDRAAPAEARGEVREVEVAHPAAEPRRALHREYVREAGEGAAGAQRERAAGFGGGVESLRLAEVRHRIRKVHVDGHRCGDRRTEHVRSLAGVRASGVDDGDGALESRREGVRVPPVKLQVLESALGEAPRPLFSHFGKCRFACGAVPTSQLDDDRLGARYQMGGHG